MAQHLYTCICILLAFPVSAFELPETASQAVVGTTKSWQSSHLTLSFYEKDAEGTWRRTDGPWKGRCAKKGLAWGRGLHPLSPAAPQKAEGDWKSPAGVFPIGGAWGYQKSIKKHPRLPYRRVTTRDLWVEDPASRHYNRHILLKHEPREPWQKKAQMRQNDYPHSLKLFIAHNTLPKPVPGAGSSIFFHIWRGDGIKPTSGCTTMHETHLRSLVAKIDPGRNPLYILLPEGDYKRLQDLWKLP